MNELYVKGWVYFKTNKTTLKEADEEFCRLCESIGLNVDNLNQEMELRDEDGYVIEYEDDGEVIKCE